MSESYFKSIDANIGLVLLVTSPQGLTTATCHKSFQF